MRYKRKIKCDFYKANKTKMVFLANLNILEFKYGKYYFNIEENLQRKGLRELRKPESEMELYFS